MYPNLYTLLVSPPGVGKSQAIDPTYDLWRATKILKLAPHSVTKAALVDALERAHRKVIINETTLVDYHSLCVAAGEFGVLVPAHDLEFLSVLNYIYDNPPSYSEERRHMANEVDISFPQFNLLAGTQPAYLAGLLPEEAWGMGFMSRQIMVYSSLPVEVDLFAENPFEEDLGQKALRKCLLDDLIGMTKLYGQIKWSDEAAVELQRWYKSGMEPVPSHSKLVHYNSRRILHTLKLCQVASISAGRFEITLPDLTRARDWLLAAESTMPDVFREMVHRSDAQVIQELHFFVWSIWVKDKKPVHETRLVHFLSAKVPSDKIDRILQMADRANVVSRLAGTPTWIPKPKTSHGVE